MHGRSGSISTVHRLSVCTSCRCPLHNLFHYRCLLHNQCCYTGIARACSSLHSDDTNPTHARRSPSCQPAVRRRSRSNRACVHCDQRSVAHLGVGRGGVGDERRRRAAVLTESRHQLRRVAVEVVAHLQACDEPQYAQPTITWRLAGSKHKTRPKPVWYPTLLHRHRFCKEG